MTDSGPRAPAPNELPWVIEALLFVSDEPQPLAALANAAGVSEGAVRKALGVLSRDFEARGLRVMEDGQRYQLVTAPDYAPYIDQLLGAGPGQKLSRAALEVLTIVAYKQPCSRAEIEAIRGVNSDRLVTQLEMRGLVEAVGVSEGPGRARLFRTTMKFLEHFGLESPQDLPPIPVDEAPVAPETL
ncbi:MAG TPA: SMC-Scp complex subunit ScpB [Tepidiformaceae bacterium]|nr:SMC-Scp complex subunit ScpB [Tepidiformaceae bacterium]